MNIQRIMKRWFGVLMLLGGAFLVLLVSFSVFVTPGTAPHLEAPTEAPLRFDGERAFQDLEYQVALGPRIPESAAHSQAVDWMLAELTALHESHDALILSGGVSMGDFDFVPGALKHLGAELVFHRIEQKPGRPMWFGVSRNAKPIFALPGNPVSTLVCMARYVVPALRTALGDAPPPEHAILKNVPDGGPARFTWFVPVTLRTNTSGQLEAAAHAINTSGDFSALAGTDGIAELAADPDSRKAGAVVQVFRW